MEKSKKRQNEVCTKEELEQFVTIHQRFKQIIKGPRNFEGDYDYFKTELAEDVKDFWPVIRKMCLGLIEHGSIITWHTKLESIIATVHDVPIRCEWENVPFLSTAKERLIAEHDLDTLMVKLCKYFGVRKEDFTIEKIQEQSYREEQRDNLVKKPAGEQKKQDYYEVIVGKGKCNIGRSIKLLEQVIADTGRHGVSCPERTWKSFKKFFREKGYSKMIEQFRWNKEEQKLHTEIPVGKLFMKKI